MVETVIPVLVLLVWLIGPWWVSRWWRDRRSRAEAARFWEGEAAELEQELKIAALGHRVVDERLRQRLALFAQQRPEQYTQALAGAGIADPDLLAAGSPGKGATA